MAARAWNGTTFTLGTAVGKLVGSRYTVAGAVIDVTEPADTDKLFEAGQPDREVQLDFKGRFSVLQGAAGDASLAYGDGSTRTIGRCVVTQVSETGQQDGQPTSTVTIKRTTTA